jgi:pyrroline-5-carboxylate reductase
LFGAGKMGGAMLEGWLAGGLPPSAVTVIDPRPSAALAALAGHGLVLNPAPDALGHPEVVILAIKPQTLDAAAAGLIAVSAATPLVLSVLAGKTIADIRARAPRLTRIIRAMPNTPAAVGRGITGCAASSAVTDADRAVATRLLTAIGAVEWVGDEALIDAVTAVSGSGPAYVFHLVECMAKAGEEQGLPPALAMTLARATVEGAGELMFREPGTEAATLRKNVTSPAGTTAAALEVLMAPDAMPALLSRAIAAARRRAEELSG